MTTAGRCLRAISGSLALALMCTSAPPLHAEPAPYHWWRSKLDGKRVCSQTPLGSGWEKAGGPYLDSQCTRRAPRPR